MSPIPECHGKGEREGGGGGEGEGQCFAIWGPFKLQLAWKFGEACKQAIHRSTHKKPTAAIDTCLKGKCMNSR